MQLSRFTPFPILTTERLVLRKIAMSDDNVIFLLRSNPEGNKYIVRPATADVEAARAWITRINKSVDAGQNINWAITLKDSGAFIGLICLWNFSDDNTIAETGYELVQEYQGKGFMNEALISVIDYVFLSLKLSSIEAYTQKGNSKSITLLKNNGFILDPLKKDEEYPLNAIYTLSKKP